MSCSKLYAYKTCSQTGHKCLLVLENGAVWSKTNQVPNIVDVTLACAIICAIIALLEVLQVYQGDKFKITPCVEIWQNLYFK